MALRNIPTREMVALTRTMVDPTHADHQIIMARPMLASCMPELTAAHTDAIGVHRTVDIERRYKAIVDEQGVTDQGHDNSMRGIWYRLKAEEYLARTPEDAAMFRDLRKWLMPGGLAMVNLSYREEIGHAEMIAGHITPDQEALLERLGTYDSDMLGVVRTWLAQADRLGQLEHERSGMIARGDGRRISVKARSRWIRIIEHMRRAVEFLGDDPDVAEIMDRIARAEQQVAKRGSRRAGSDDSTGSPGEADTEIRVPDQTAQPVGLGIRSGATGDTDITGATDITGDTDVASDTDAPAGPEVTGHDMRSRLPPAARALHPEPGGDTIHRHRITAGVMRALPDDG